MKSMRLLSWNVNGLRAVHKKGFLEWLARDNPDVLCVQETKLQVEQVPKEIVELEGYHKYYSSAERKGYSGVASFTKQEPLNVQKGFGVERFDREGRTLALDFGQFILFNVYFPNGKLNKERLQYKMDFYSDFLTHINSLKNSGKNIIVCGDVNTAHKEIDLARPKDNEKSSGFLPEERAWIDELLSHGFVDTFRLFNADPGYYSWWDMRTRARERDIGWRIDYFYVNEEFKDHITSAFILPDVFGSDHCPIGIEIDFE